MEIFLHNFVFKSWGEVYLGYKMNWLQPKLILDYCLQKKIKSCDKGRYVALSNALDESLYEFLELIKKYVIQDKNTPIIKNEDERENTMDYIPGEYWEVWKLEFLLRVVKNTSSIEERSEKIYELFYRFNFPNDWQSFIIYSSIYPKASLKELDSNMYKYLEKKIEALAPSHT